MITADQAKNMLKTIEDAPERWAASVNTILVDMVDRLDKVTTVLKKTHSGAAQLAKEVGQIHGLLTQITQGGASGPEAEVAGVVAAVPEAAVAVSGVRMGADGEPISNPNQLDAEALMDAAIAGSEPTAPPAPRVRRNGNGSGRRPAAQVPSTAIARVGADGKPLSEDQAAIEAAMDAAIDG